DWGGGAYGQPHAKPDAERREPWSAFGRRKDRNRDNERHRGSSRQALRRAKRVAALPGEHRPERQHDDERHNQRREGKIEERRSDGNFFTSERFQQQRIERADKYGGARRGEEAHIQNKR